MAGSAQTHAYQQLLKAMVELRHETGLSQAQLAKVLGKPASFVGKYELGERRLDVIELFVILKALGQDPMAFIEQCEISTPTTLS